RSALGAAQRNLDSLRRLQTDGAASPADVRQAEVTLHSAQADVTLLEQKKKDRYSQPEIARVNAQAAEAQAAYDAAEDALGKSSVRAPFDGMVYALPVKQGAFVDEPDIGRLHVGQKVEVTWDAMQGRTWTGTVSTIPSTVKLRGNRNVGETTCTIDNHDLRLLPNVNVGVTIIVDERNNVLTLQRDALHTDDSKLYVYRIVDNQLKRQPVEISLQNLTRVEITGGLDEGASVALPAEENKPLFDGAFVKVVH